MNINDIKGIRSYSEGVIEYGIVETIIEDQLVKFSVEDYSNGIHLVQLNEDTQESRELLLKYGVEFREGTGIINDGDFTDHIYKIYNKSGSVIGQWLSDDYEDYWELFD